MTANRRSLWACRLAWLMLGVATLLVPVARAGAAEFYTGKTIDLYIGFGVGGTYDLYARLVAQFLGRHIPGAPAIVPRSMPGAGGLAAANYMSRVAARDGTALAITSQTVGVDQLFGVEGVAYDALKFNWIGRVASSQTIFFTWHDSPTKSFADALKRETSFGSSGSGDTTDTPRALNRLAGTKFKLVIGYRGSTDVMLAVERGEVEGGYALWSEFKSHKADWLSDHQVNLLYFMADERMKDYPEIPLSEELVASDEARQILHLFSSPGVIGRAIFTAPAVPEARVALLRQAFLAMLADRDFLAEAARIGLAVDPLSGAELQLRVQQLMRTPADLITKAEAARRP